MNTLVLNEVSKKIGKKQILNKVSLTLKSGEIVGLVGPNGAGKTTIMKIITGLSLPTQGSISVCGTDMKDDKVKALENIGFLVEEPGLYRNISGKKNLEILMDIRNINKDNLAYVADLLNFDKQLKNKVKTYSIGMKQRLALALSFIMKPKLLVLDEPLNGLDPDGIFLLRDKVKEIASTGTSVLISSHLLGELEKVADRIIFIKQGNIIIPDENSDNTNLEELYSDLFLNRGENNENAEI